MIIMDFVLFLASLEVFNYPPDVARKPPTQCICRRTVITSMDYDSNIK